MDKAETALLDLATALDAFAMAHTTENRPDDQAVTKAAGEFIDALGDRVSSQAGQQIQPMLLAIFNDIDRTRNMAYCSTGGDLQLVFSASTAARRFLTLAARALAVEPNGIPEAERAVADAHAAQRAAQRELNQLLDEGDGIGAVEASARVRITAPRAVERAERHLADLQLQAAAAEAEPTGRWVASAVDAASAADSAVATAEAALAEAKERKATATRRVETFRQIDTDIRARVAGEQAKVARLDQQTTVRQRSIGRAAPDMPGPAPTYEGRNVAHESIVTDDNTSGDVAMVTPTVSAETVNYGVRKAKVPQATLTEHILLQPAADAVEPPDPAPSLWARNRSSSMRRVG